MKVHLTLKSANVKTGPIPVSTSSNETCPNSCPFKAKGCYAKSGPLALHWSKVSNGERGFEWAEFLIQIKSLPNNQIWRHNQAGDLAGIGEEIDADKIFELTTANHGKRGFTYTHKHSGYWNQHLIAQANNRGFTVNMSANSLSHADELADTGCGPVCVVLDSNQNTNTVTPNGRKVVICPATQRDDITCAKCGLCQQARRTVIVGFPAHGTAKKTVSTLVSK